MSTDVDLSTLDALDQARLVSTGQISARELVEAAIARIERLNPELNAVITPMFDDALARTSTGPAPTGPFAGVPYLLKDLAVECAGVRFSEGSRFLRDHVSREDSELVVRLREAGLIILGKTNTPEFGMVPACEPVLHGPTRNPWDTERSTSGSSGGAAAAVASGMVPMADANDLGGSIRYPASACGLFGLKPSRGRTPLGPHYGDVVSGWASIHAVTRSVRDSAALLDALSGPGVGDPYFAPPHRRTFLEEVGAPPGRLRIAYTARTPDGGLGHPDSVGALDDAVGLCDQLGHELFEADLPGLDGEVGQAIGTVFPAATSWIVRYWSAQLGREPGVDELEPLTRAFWELGEQVTAGQYLVAIGVLQRFARTVAEFFRGVDLWLTPTMSAPPAPIGAITSTPEAPLRALEVGGETVKYPGVVANITGAPAMSVPLWTSGEGLPMGVHFLASVGDEATLFRLAAQLEAARPWAQRIPQVHASR